MPVSALLSLHIAPQQGGNKITATNPLFLRLLLGSAAYINYQGTVAYIIYQHTSAILLWGLLVL